MVLAEAMPLRVEGWKVKPASKIEQTNPFLNDAALGATADELRRMEWERQQNIWEAHVAACLAIMENGVLKRLELAAEAVRQWGSETQVIGVTRTETHTGRVHLRAKIIIGSDTNCTTHLEFIASPKSMVIAAQGSRAHENRRWKKVSLTADAISLSVDEVLRDFLQWGVES